MPKETGILMSGNHPKLILDGLKTMTRRVIVPQPSFEQGVWYWQEGARKGEIQSVHYDSLDALKDYLIYRCPYGQVGDRLWVRETWATEKRLDHLSPSELGKAATAALWYKADADQRSLLERGKWRPSIFMPRWASRITREIIEVRVARLQEISGQDIKAEGLDVQFTIPGAFDALERFSVLWDSLNAKRSFPWDFNPWVWPIRFRMIKQ